MNLLKYIFVFSFLFVFSNCSSITIANHCHYQECSDLTEEDCSSKDWEKEFFSRGQQGKKFYNPYAESCAAIGITMNNTKLQDSNTLGLQSYCTSKNAMEKGKAGNEFELASCQTININLQADYNAGLGFYCTENMGMNWGSNLNLKPSNICKSNSKYITGYKTGFSEKATKTILAIQNKIDRSEDQLRMMQQDRLEMQTALNKLENKYSECKETNAPQWCKNKSEETNKILQKISNNDVKYKSILLNQNEQKEEIRKLKSGLENLKSL